MDLISESASISPALCAAGVSPFSTRSAIREKYKQIKKVNNGLNKKSGINKSITNNTSDSKISKDEIVMLIAESIPEVNAYETRCVWSCWILFSGSDIILLSV